MGHIHGDSEYDFTASAMIVHSDKVLLLFHRKLQKWLMPGGHIELNETPTTALYREIEEETGLTKNHLTLVTPYRDNLDFERSSSDHTEPVPFDIDIHVINAGGHQHIDMSYIFASDMMETTLEKGGGEKLQWFTLEEIETLSPMPKKVYSRAKYALEKVKESQL